MAITKITGDVVDAGSVGSALSVAYSLRVFVDTGDGNKTKLQLVAVDGSTTTVVSTIDMTALYTDLGDIGRT